jgi:DNA-binding CsgD family transcriptional regulator
MSISVEPTSQPCSLSIERADATLVLRYLVKPEAERLLVLLHEQRRDFCPATLAPLGLSPRECEILYWVMHGKTNPEIGVILGLSPRTIGTRLEALFRKLGVQTRPAAAMRARELLAQLGW